MSTTPETPEIMDTEVEFSDCPDELFDRFERSREEKWDAGAKEHRAEGQPFQGDWADELQNETLDIPNYAEVGQSLGEVPDEVAERLHANMLGVS